MPKYIMFVHGYSESSLGAYFQFPQILKNAVPTIERVALAAFDSLDDGITIDDLADAMEVRVASMEADGWDVSDSAFICHSTGALITRRWVLNRLSDGKRIPSHLITIAGANHGSSLAGMGKSVLGYLQKLALHHELSVGQAVLTDLEYGSDFLLQLNREWLEAWNDGRLTKLFAFSMGGDTNGSDKDPTLKIFWETKEPGSDNTVRISGANLNYAFINVMHDENGTNVSAVYPTLRVPHLVLAGYSHYGPTTGILGDVHDANAPPMKAVIAALGVADPGAYASLEQTWRTATDEWTKTNPGNANSTAIFSLLDRSGTPIDDCMISLLDQKALGGTANAFTMDDTSARVQAMMSASEAVLPHSPIHNDVQTGSYAFYLNYAKYLASSPHWFHVEFGDSTLIGQHKYIYTPMLFTQPPDLQHTIAPNECSYLHMPLGRTSNEAYYVWRWDAALDMDATTFPPFDKNVDFLVAPPPPAQ